MYKCSLLASSWTWGLTTFEVVPFSLWTGLTEIPLTVELIFFFFLQLASETSQPHLSFEPLRETLICPQSSMQVPIPISLCSAAVPSRPASEAILSSIGCLALPWQALFRPKDEVVSLLSLLLLLKLEPKNEFTLECVQIFKMWDCDVQFWSFNN